MSRFASWRHARTLEFSLIFDGFTDSSLVETFNQNHYSFVAKICTHFPQLLVLERSKKLKLGLPSEIGEEVKKNRTQTWPYLCGILFNSFPNRPLPRDRHVCYNWLTVQKVVWTRKVRVLTFGRISPVLRLDVRNPRKNERMHAVCSWMCAFFCFSFVCISAYAYVFEIQVHCGGAVPFSWALPGFPAITAHHLYAFLLWLDC